MATTELDRAREDVTRMLDMARALGAGDEAADAVFASLRNTRREHCERIDFTEADAEWYDLLFLALADLTGEPRYRGC